MERSIPALFHFFQQKGVNYLLSWSIAFRKRRWDIFALPRCRICANSAVSLHIDAVGTSSFQKTQIFCIIEVYSILTDYSYKKFSWLHKVSLSFDPKNRTEAGLNTRQPILLCNTLKYTYSQNSYDFTVECTCRYQMRKSFTFIQLFQFLCHASQK